MLTLLAIFCCAILPATAQTNITVQNPGFGPVGGRISGTLDLNPLNPAPASITQHIGSSNWYGQANVTTITTLGFRPGIEVDDVSSAGVGYISYALGASLGGLVGLEMPEAYLWQPMPGWSLAANTTYVFSMEVDAGSLLDVTALGSRGFGLGLSVGSTTTSPGTFVADTVSNPALLSLTLLGGTARRLTMNFTTGATPPTGVPGVAVFAGRGVQALQVALLENYRMDNASVSSYSAVPEPSVVIIVFAGLGMLVVMQRPLSLRN